jgi:D-aminoacyl-tRNA deacylase
MADYLKEILGMEPIGDKEYRCKDMLLIEVDEDIIYTDYVEDEIGVNPGSIIFLSRHSSASHIRTLSVHVSGNPIDSNEYGGKKYSLAPSDPILMKNVLCNLYEYSESRGLSEEYKVTLEVTHHGPTEIKAPSFFVEVGSTIEEWRDNRAIKVIIDSLLDAVKKPKRGVPAVGFGGPHYAPTFTRYVLREDYAVGHIFSKYVVDKLPSDIVRTGFQKTSNADVALFDWKGIRGGVRQQLKDLVEGWGYSILRI